MSELKGVGPATASGACRVAEELVNEIQSLEIGPLMHFTSPSHTLISHPVRRGAFQGSFHGG